MKENFYRTINKASIRLDLDFGHDRPTAAQRPPKQA